MRKVLWDPSIHTVNSNSHWACAHPRGPLIDFGADEVLFRVDTAGSCQNISPCAITSPLDSVTARRVLRYRELGSKRALSSGEGAVEGI